MAVASDAPVSPKKPFIYMVAFFASIALGIGLIAAKEFLNKKILFRSEIESLTSVPVVAEITNTKKRESLVNTASKTSYVADQFRQLRASIGLYGNFNSNKKKILVTSSISGEGKSYISVNLAISLALAFKKVVLIDLDIRNPKTSSLLCVADRPGVTEFLEGTKYPEEIISKTQYENLFTIGAGGDADNARELILNGKLKELISYLETVFDYIIVDTSPIDPVTDAYVLSEHFDITLFIVRHGYTPKTVVQLMDYNNKIKFLKNPCIVFNDIRSRGFFVGNYGFGFGYGYQNVYRGKTRKEAGELMQA
jgi:capsular exopolysaccharide synthesis family protein